MKNRKHFSQLGWAVIVISTGMLTACYNTTTHAVVPGAPLGVVPLRRNVRTTLTMRNGPEREFGDVRVVGDTLYGWSKRSSRQVGDSVSIAASRIESIRQVESSASGMVFVALMGIFWGGLALASWALGGP